MLQRSGFIFALALVLSANNSFAQDRSYTLANNIVTTIIKTLKLNENQIKPVMPIITDWFKKAQQIKAKHLSYDEEKQKLHSLQNDMEDQLKHYLTPEQLRRWRNLAAPAPKKSASKQPTERTNNAAKTGVLQSNTDPAKGSGIY